MASLSLHKWYEEEKKKTPERELALRGKLDDSKRDYLHGFRVGFADMWLDGWEVARLNGTSDLDFLKLLAVESNAALARHIESFPLGERPVHTVTANLGYLTGVRAAWRSLSRKCDVEDNEIPESRIREVYDSWREVNPEPYDVPYQFQKARVGLLIPE